MTEETVIRLMKSKLDEDVIIASNYIMAYWELGSVIEFFKKHGIEDASLRNSIGLSTKYIPRNVKRSWDDVRKVVNEQALIFIGSGVWLLDPEKYESYSIKDATI